jgi:hypothetical protein
VDPKKGLFATFRKMHLTASMNFKNFLLFPTKISTTGLQIFYLGPKLVDVRRLHEAPFGGSTVSRNKLLRLFTFFTFL